jgi:hypothetical protein
MAAATSSGHQPWRESGQPRSGAADPLVGFVLVDDIVELYHDELTESLGAISPQTMEESARPCG